MMGTRDLADDTLAVILAGGVGARLEPLTLRVCKPALPFGAGFRNIDFTLSNCLNSGIRAIGVPVQYKPQALVQHLREVIDQPDANCVVTPWRAEVRAPRLGYRGTADAVYRNLDLIEAHGRRLVLILAGDHVYKMDYRPMLEQHCESRAAVTIGCIEVPVEDARHFGVVALGERNRIERFVEKPRSPAELPPGAGATVLASMGIYVFDTEYLKRVLTADAFAPDSRHDFGADVLPRIVRAGGAFAYSMAGSATGRAYWRDIGTLSAYWHAHMELLGPEPPLALDDPRWPLVASADAPRRVTSRSTTPGRGSVEDALIGADAVIAGRVRRSVVSRGVTIARDCEIADAVILPGATIGAACRLQGVIVDADCAVAPGTVVSAAGAEPGSFEPVVLTNGESGSLRHRARAGV